MIDSSKSIAVVSSSSPNNQAFGTAFVVRATQTYDTFVTCAHVVQEVGEGSILVGGQEATVLGIGESDGNDLAVLRVASAGNRTALRLREQPSKGASCTVMAFDKLAKAASPKDWQVLIGDRWPIEQRRTGKQISAWELQSNERELIPGNSGAPVIDDSGAVVAVVSYQLPASRGLSIAAEHIRAIWPDASYQEGPNPSSGPAIQLDAVAWALALERSGNSADRLLLEAPLTGEDEAFRSFEVFLESAPNLVLSIAFGHSSSAERPGVIRNSLQFRTLILAALARGTENSAKWLLAQTVARLQSGSIEAGSVLMAVWKALCSPKERGEDIARLCRLMFEEMHAKKFRKHNQLYAWVHFLLSQVITDELTLRVVAQLLAEHDEQLGNEAPTPYLEKLKRLHGEAIALAERDASRPSHFAPSVSLIPATEICPYEFEAMVEPMTVAEQAHLSGRPMEEAATLPHVFHFLSPQGALFNLLGSEVASLVNLCNQFGGDERHLWAVPTLCEWLALADCVDSRFPWGDTPPTADLANLAFGNFRRLKPVGTFPKGASRHKTLDCCGNVHEIVLVSPDALRASVLPRFPDDYRIVGGCFQTDPRVASCHIVRPFRPRVDDDRKNVGLRLIRFNRSDRPRRREALLEFLASGHEASRFRMR